MAGQLVIQVVVMLAFGGVCAAIAPSRGRNPVAWFAIGFFLGCIGLIIILVIPDLKAESTQRRGLERENRRLREQLRLDRQIADQRHLDTERRIGVHDRALGLDTAPATPELLAPIKDSSPLKASNHSDVAWYYGADGRQEGPVHFELLRQMWKEGRLRSEQYVWCQNLKEWQPLVSVPGLREALDA